MDPLSITVSIVTLLGIGGSISNAFENLATIQHVPDAFLALSNEISSLRLIMLEANNVLQDHHNNSSADPSQQTFVNNLIPILNRIKFRLLELESLIEYRLTTPGLIRETKVNKLSWIKAQPKLKAIQDEIRSSRLNLVTAIGLLALKATSRIELQLSELHLYSRSLQGQQDQSHAAIAQSMVSQRNIEHCIPEVLQSQERIERTLNEYLRSRTASQGEQARYQKSSISTIQPRTIPSGDRVARWDLQLKAVRKKRNFICTSGCSCCCHQRYSRKSLSFLQSLLGILFIGYTGVPLISGCDSKSCCQKSDMAVSIRYYFPEWFMSQILDVHIERFRPGGLITSIRVYRTVSVDSPVFRIIDFGNVADMEALLTSRQASPFDVAHSYSGMTPLHYALRSKRLDICRLLLDAGADAHYQDDNQRSSHDHAWKMILGTYSNTPRAEILRSLFPNPDLEDNRFNSIHEGLLGLSSLSLEMAFQQSPEISINDGDMKGRTALAWSASRNDPTALEFILHKGADVHKVDRTLQTPLHSAAISNSYSCARLLLRHGSKVDCIDYKGWAAIHYVATNSDNTDLLDLLISYQADIDALTNSGYSPLHLAIDWQNFRIATKIIQLGANIHVYAKNGFSALSTAIWRKAHPLIKTFLRKGADHTIEIVNYGSILHWIAQHADIKTLQILTAGSLSPRDTNLLRHDGLTAIDVGRQRADFGPEWLDHFSAFLRSLNPTPIPQCLSDDDNGKDSSGEGDTFEDARES